MEYQNNDSKETREYKQAARKVLIDALRRKGTYQHNIKVLEKGSGELCVKKCPVIPTSYTRYLPCEFCLEFYYRPDLHRHMKTCLHRNNSAIPAGRVQSKAALLLPVRRDVCADLNKILVKMRDDAISTVVKSDELIIKYGNVLCRKHYNNEDQDYYISNKLRELGRFVVCMRITVGNLDLKRMIDPKNFTVIVNSVRSMCGWDEEERTIDTPSLGMWIIFSYY